MAWITLSEDDIRTRLAGPELAALSTRALAEGQADPVPEILAGVVREVRGRVAACARNVLGPTGTIPDELLHHALALARYRILTRLPARSLVTEDRRAEYQDALRVLEAVARCDVAIVPPPDPAEAQPGAPAPRIRPRRTWAGGGSEGGRA